ncbi:MAG: ABC transporter ATP-binding protein [Parachlamydiaceae bacterium]|nr:ABC transporter ATP-binding protein [Parachlamydiaceae bacterium]
MPPSPLISIEALAKSYPMGHGIVEALKPTTLHVSAGESLAIMGPSGSGKSTLLHLLGCLDSPTSGRYLFDGQDVSHLDDSALAHIRAYKIGFVFQAFNLIPQLTVLENIELPFVYQKNPPSNLSDRIAHSLEKVGLSHRLHHHPSELSGGEMQRVAIARALASAPRVLLADEPTGNLDRTNGTTILKLFMELQEQGTAVIIVTHDATVASYCQRTIHMQDGSIHV